jgi:multiple sugar transport system ATP-binding protein
VKKADGVYFVYEGNELKLPEDKATNPALAEYIGQEVVAGLRPECIFDDPAAIAGCENATLDAYVDVTELMGAEIYLYLMIGEAKFISRVSSRSKSTAGQTIKLAFDTTRVHIFDKDTERCIIH